MKITADESFEIKGHKFRITAQETENGETVFTVERIDSNPELLEAFKQEHLYAHGADPYKECEGCKLIAKHENNKKPAQNAHRD